MAQRRPLPGSSTPTGSNPGTPTNRGAIVHRPGLQLGVPGKPGVQPKKKPSIRNTIDSMASTGSQAEYFRPDQTIIIFDWDDTLCPSSWIRANRTELSFFKPAPKIEKFQRPLRALQQRVEALLNFAMTLGSVIIVTNAMDPWVLTSCRNFLPQLLPLITRLPIIYARTIFETMTIDPPRSLSPGAGARPKAMANNRVAKALPGLYDRNGQNRLGSYNSQLEAQRRYQPQQAQIEMDPQKWKEVAFEQEINGFYSRYAHQSWKNVISIGDSIFERDALRRVMLTRKASIPSKTCRTKTLKLFDDPDCNELIEQVRVCHDVLNMVVRYDGELDIEIDEEDLKVDMPLAEKIRD